MHLKSIASKKKEGGILRHLYHSLSLKTFKRFWSSMPEMGMKIKHVFNHNITFLLGSNHLYLKTLNLSIKLQNEKRMVSQTRALVSALSTGF